MTELSVWLVFVSNVPLRGGAGRIHVTIGTGNGGCIIMDKEIHYKAWG